LFDVRVGPFKVIVYFIIATLYCIISSMKHIVTAPEDNRNFIIRKPLLDDVVEEQVMCLQMKLFWLCPQMKRIRIRHSTNE
jgi:hypothetical protein